MNCVTFGLCIFDCINFVFCYCVLLKPCRDRCFTPWTLVKWVLKAGIFGYTIYLVNKREDEALAEREESLAEGVFIEYEEDDGNLATYLWVYVLQHVIFITARIPIFILYSLLTCCCDKGAEYPNAPNRDEPEFNDRIISFDYIDYELHGMGGNFPNHVIGLNEIEYNRNLSVIRRHQQEVIGQQYQQPNMSQL